MDENQIHHEEALPSKHFQNNDQVILQHVYVHVPHVEFLLDPIMKNGLLPMSRLHVHMSGDLETATKVGSRRGKPIILEVDTKAMIQDGCVFYLSENGVWLTDKCLPKYLQKMT